MAEILRYSRRVPESGVNLSWVEIPPLDVVENISLVETGRFIAENIDLVWREKLNAGVLGISSQTPNVTGFLYYTTYNTPIDNLALSGQAISAGVSAYQIPRERTSTVTPSGFVIDNFTAEIRVLHPRPSEAAVWRLRVQDGVIVRRYILRSSDNSWLKKMYSVGDELMLFYSVSEAARIPYKNDDTTYLDSRVVDVSGVLATVLDEHTIQLPDTDLYEIRSLRINGEQQILSTSGILTATTSNTVGQEPPRGPFTAWDPQEGTLTLARSVDDDDEIYVNYRYREYLYLYEGYLDDSNVYHDLDLNPSKGHYYDRGNPSSDLLNIPIYLYLIPTAAYKIQDSAGNLEQQRKIYTADRWMNNPLRWEKTAASISNDPLASDVCRRRYTYGSSHFGTARFVDDVPVDTLNLSASGTGLANLPCALILAKLYVTSNAQIENVQVLDTRSRGGGLPESVDPHGIDLPGETRREVETYWDTGGWDGQPVPLGGVLLVELPGALLTGTSGFPQFTQDEIERIVRQHVAAGIRVVIRYL
jgi:hypothetical protein